ncbi:CKLF-like MARVEL transmembrane domain-containing protein 5, partial [Ophiophagus hannah]
MGAALLEILVTLTFLGLRATYYHERLTRVNWPCLDFLRCVSAAIIFIVVGFAVIATNHEGSAVSAFVSDRFSPLHRESDSGVSLWGILGDRFQSYSNWNFLLGRLQNLPSGDGIRRRPRASVNLHAHTSSGENPTSGLQLLYLRVLSELTPSFLENLDP